MILSGIRIVVSTLLFALIHSLLASRAAKERAAGLFGRRQRNGLYRWFYIAQSFVTLGALAAYALPLPDRVLYRAPKNLSILMRLVQALGLAHAVYAAYQVGLSRITGIQSGLAWLQQRAEVPPEPEAQGPALDEHGDLRAAGPFRWSRHPLNFSPLVVFWFNPVMTVKLLAFNLISTVYLVLGSLHEESRLKAAYGADYSAYQNSGVPFYIPFIQETLNQE